MTLTVLVTDRVSKRGLLPLKDDEQFNVVRARDRTAPKFLEAIGLADALIVRSATRVDEALLGTAARLKVVGRAGVGIDNIDVAAASRRGIAVVNAPSGNTIAAAELTMALMLSVMRKVTEADRSMREGRWDRAGFQGSELRGKTLGLVGAGRVGGEVAIRCQAFGMSVIVSDPYLSGERAAELGVDLVSLEEVISGADVISLHVPLNDETRGLIGKEALKSMKKHAYVINASRGGVIDETALARALEKGRIAGAALDVFDAEPLPEDSPLRTAPNLIMTPHLGASTREAQISVAREVALAVREILLDGDTSKAINAADLG